MRFLIVVLGLVAATRSAAAQDAPVRVILIIADGAGAGHWGVAAYAMARPAVMDFPVVGLMDTRGPDHVVTGSAAAATALATGVGASRGALGVAPDSQPRETLFEVARARGLATGLVTTTWIVDATPAAFIAHTPVRRDWATLFEDYAAFEPEVMLGGGRVIFSDRIRERGLDPDPVRDGYTYVTTAEEFRALDLARTERLLGLFADADLPLAAERDPSLADLTGAALTMLHRNPRGFVLLVENEETDTQAHRNAGLDTLMAELVALDDAIRVALDYQRRNPETLIVVTGDHETGGLSMRGDYSGEDGVIALFYHTVGHTAEPIPLFATGPGAERFAGFLANHEVGRRLQEHVRGARP